MKIIKVLWFFSFPAFLALQLWMYASLESSTVSITYDQETGVSDFFLSRDQFFYTSLALFVLLNGLLIGVGNLLARLPIRILPVPNAKAWGQSIRSRRTLGKRLRLWVQGLAFTGNFFFIALTAYIYGMNDRQFTTDLSPLFLISVVLLGLWATSSYFLFQPTREKGEAAL